MSASKEEAPAPALWSARGSASAENAEPVAVSRGTFRGARGSSRDAPGTRPVPAGEVNNRCESRSWGEVPVTRAERDEPAHVGQLDRSGVELVDGQVARGGAAFGAGDEAAALVAVALEGLAREALDDGRGPRALPWSAGALVAAVRAGVEVERQPAAGAPCRGRAHLWISARSMTLPLVSVKTCAVRSGSFQPR